MKLNFLLTGFVILMTMLVARGAEPEIEFSGVLVTGPETRVALARKGQSPAQWVLVGGEFGEFTVSAYEAKPGVVVLAKNGEQFRIALKEAKVAPGDQAAPEPPPEIKKAILNNLRQLAAAADQYYLENGKMTATFTDLVGPDRYVKAMEAKAGEDYHGLKFVQGQPLSVTTSEGFTISWNP